MNPLFELGQIVQTRGVAGLNLPIPVSSGFLLQHMFGRWGNVCEEDRESNDNAVKNGDRVLSAYEYEGEKIWIITEADRSVTTLLLPEEY